MSIDNFVNAYFIKDAKDTIKSLSASRSLVDRLLKENIDNYIGLLETKGVIENLERLSRSLTFNKEVMEHLDEIGLSEEKKKEFIKDYKKLMLNKSQLSKLNTIIKELTFMQPFVSSYYEFKRLMETNLKSIDVEIEGATLFINTIKSIREMKNHYKTFVKSYKVLSGKGKAIKTIKEFIKNNKTKFEDLLKIFKNEDDFDIDVDAHEITKDEMIYAKTFRQFL